MTSAGGVSWEGPDEDDIKLTPAQTEEIDRRLAAVDAEPGEPWADVEARLRQRLR
jgi:putative addiction module component (TIGR02574 family)